MLATRQADGTIVLAAWNLVPPAQSGLPKTVTLRFKNIAPTARPYISRVDRQHGDPHVAYQKMGSPRYPTQMQLKELGEATVLPAPESAELNNNEELTITLPPDALALIQLK